MGQFDAVFLPTGANVEGNMEVYDNSNDTRTNITQFWNYTKVSLNNNAT